MTAVTEILTHCKKLISEGHQIDTQGLVHWIEDKLLEMEKQQIIDAHFAAQIEDIRFWDEAKQEALDYYKETYKSE